MLIHIGNDVYVSYTDIKSIEKYYDPALAEYRTKVESYSRKRPVISKIDTKDLVDTVNRLRLNDQNKSCRPCCTDRPASDG